MTITSIRTPDRTLVAPEPIPGVAADLLLSAMTDAGLDDPRWEAAGPLVTAAAQRLRQALGTAVHGECVSVPAVVREADFALAARPLLTGAVIVEPEAARQFVRLAAAAALALR